MIFRKRHQRDLRKLLDAEQERLKDLFLAAALEDTVELEAVPCACTWHYGCPEHDPLHPDNVR